MQINPQYDNDSQIALGKVNGYKLVTLFGRNPDVDAASAFETIWNGGAAYTGHNAIAAQTVSIVSDSVNDTSAGTGARTLKVYGLDANYIEQSETVTLNGTTPVLTSGKYIRMSYAEVKSVGSNIFNAGTIIANQSTTTANIFFAMPPGFNHTAVLAYTVPAGKQVLIKEYTASVISKLTSNCEVRLIIREFGEVWRVEDIGGFSDKRNFSKRYNFYFDDIVPEKSDIRVDVDSDTNNTIVGGTLCMMQVNL